MDTFMDCLSHAIAMDIKLFHFQIYEFQERAKLLYLKFGMLYIYVYSIIQGLTKMVSYYYPMLKLGVGVYLLYFFENRFLTDIKA